MTHCRVRPTEKPWHSVWLDKEFGIFKELQFHYPPHIPRHLIFLLKTWAVMYFEKLGQCYPWVQGIFCVPVSYNGHPLEHPLCDIMTLWGPNWPGRGASSFVKLGTPCLLAMFKQITSNNRNVSMKPEEKSNYLYKVIPHQACQFTCYKAI